MVDIIELQKAAIKREGVLAVRDANVVARYDATDLNYVVKDSSNRIIALLDKSKRLQLGNELITNAADREFTSDTGFWIKGAGCIIGNGVFDTTSTTTGIYSVLLRKNGITPALGKICAFEIEIKSIVSGSLQLWVGGNIPNIILNVVGKYKFYFISNDTQYRIELSNVGTVFKGTFTNLSLKEVLGNHITQTDTAKMPIHTNRYNLLTYSEDFSNAAWTKPTNILIPNATLSPVGTNNATKVIPSSSANHHRLYTVIADGETRSISLYAKSAGYNYVIIADDSYASFKSIIVDLTNGNVTNNPSNVSINVINVNNGWYRIEINNTKKYIAQTNLSLSIIPFYKSTTDSHYGYETFQGDNTSGIFLWGVQCEQSNFAGKYQRINAANDYDTNGFEYYAQFDGVDDYLKALPFTLTQPTAIYSCLKQISWTSAETLYDGIASATCRLNQFSTAPTLGMYANGTTTLLSSNLNIGSYGNIYTLFNGVNSIFKINNYVGIKGDAGTSNANLFVLGSRQDGNLASNIAVKEIIIKRIATDESDTIFNYFKNKHKVTY